MKYLLLAPLALTAMFSQDLAQKNYITKSVQHVTWDFNLNFYQKILE